MVLGYGLSMCYWHSGQAWYRQVMEGSKRRGAHGSGRFMHNLSKLQFRVSDYEGPLNKKRTLNFNGMIDKGERENRL